MNTLRRRGPGIAWAITAALLYAAIGVGTAARADADESGSGPAAGADAETPGTDVASNNSGPNRPGRDKGRIESGGTDPGGSAGGGAASPGDPCPWWPVPRPVPPINGDSSRGNNGFIAVPAVVPAIPVTQFGAGAEPLVDIGDFPEDAPTATAPAAAPPATWYPAAPSLPPGPAARVVTAQVVPPPLLPPALVPTAIPRPPVRMAVPAAPPPPSQRPGAGVQPPAPVRLGYPAELRDADLAKVVSTALPGLAAMAGMTAFGGLVGYRQARAGYLTRAAGAGRFLQ